MDLLHRHPLCTSPFAPGGIGLDGEQVKRLVRLAKLSIEVLGGMGIGPRKQGL